MTTGQRIKAARKKVGLTQKELGERMGQSFQSIAQWENDLRNPKLETLQRIAAALGVSIYELTDNNDLKRAVLYGEGLGDDSDEQDDSGEIHYHTDFEGSFSRVHSPQDVPDIHLHLWQTKPGGVVHKEPLHLIDVVEYEITANEIEKLLDKLQDGEPLVLSPDELAKLKSLPKEQIAAALGEYEQREQEKRRDAVAALEKQIQKICQQYGPNDFPEFHELEPLLHKFQSGEIAQSEKERIKTLLAAAQARLKVYSETAPPPKASKMEIFDLGSSTIDPTNFLEGRAGSGKSTLINAILKDPQRRIAAALDRLNEEGQEKAAERVEELTEIPRYQAQEPPTEPSGAPGDTDTTPAETPPEDRIQAVTMVCPICGMTLSGNPMTGKAHCHYCNRSFQLPQTLK